MEGIIFEIQKFALHDGPGIRTTVFLKGCPLKCAWCCNPESQELPPQLSKDNTRTFGYKASAEQVLLEVMKDKDYYDNSGGGITLSGGEPMMQFDFTYALLSIAKKNGLHTALETSGFAATENFEKILPLVDLYLYDYKHTGNENHKQFTGVDQALILKNLEFLYSRNAQIVIRCPVIPGINDNENHFNGIKLLRNKFPGLRGIEVLGYHDYGLWKYESLGMNPCPVEAKTVSAEKVKEWILLVGTRDGKR
jgi:pyruvate formate lyase activating enzyme